MKKPIKIFSSEQTRRADEYTIAHKPISSLDLMELAATKCADWLKEYMPKEKPFLFFCGQGNNGGDGLAIARQLHLFGYNVEVYILSLSQDPSADFKQNEERFKKLPQAKCRIIQNENELPEIGKGAIVLDCIFGTGLNKPVSGLAAYCIDRINKSDARVVAIDMPSGLFPDSHSGNNFAIIKAEATLSFQFPKLAFFFPENSGYVGSWQILNIGLSKDFIDKESCSKFYVTKEFAGSILKPRNKYSHKGTFGHALIIAGSFGKMGAAVLCANACLRSGVGLLTMHIPKCGYEIMQITTPEAMVSCDENENIFSEKLNTDSFSSVAIGPGIGTENLTAKALYDSVSGSKRPVILDADALNILSVNSDWLGTIPENSILTPHLKEFERLTGKAENDFDRHEKQIGFSQKFKVYVILKGAHTCITAPDGSCYFNSTGNPGMAKGGSGDILTGVLAALLAQGYSPMEVCILGVYIHGLAGDIAKNKIGETGMVSSDLTAYLPEAFLMIEK